MTKHYLSICAILKNEALYLEEWICFHQLQGVEHFFIYENESTDNTWNILKRYESLGIATIEKVAGNGQQLATYNKCLKDHGYKSQWIAFLDCDEFLYAPAVGDGWTSFNFVASRLKYYEKFSAVAVNWVLYGSSGNLIYQNDLVINRFIQREAKGDRHVKTILQPHLTKGTGKNAHYFLLKTPAVNEKKEVLPEEYYHTEPSIEVFRINHYHTKSLEEYRKRKSYIDVDAVDRGKVEDRFKGHDVNEIVDITATGYGPEVELAISSRREAFLEKLWKEKLEGRAWQVKEEFIALLKFMMDNDVKSVLEIGVHKGGSALGFLEIGCDVVSVDIVKQPEVEYLLDLYPRFDFFYRAQFDSLISNDMSSVDVLYIDGDHSYEGCMKDYLDCRHLVKSGGFIVFHDVLKNELHAKQNCEVWKVIEEVQGNKERIDFITQDVWGGLTGIKV